MREGPARTVKRVVNSELRSVVQREGEDRIPDGNGDKLFLLAQVSNGSGFVKLRQSQAQLTDGITLSRASLSS